MTLAAGTPIGKYVVRRKLAEGGMAEIYLAAAIGPEGFEKDVVIKRVRAGLADDPNFVRMFIAEARVASRLNHANLVQIFDFDKHEDTYYLAMEYVRGRSLWELRRRAQEWGVPLPPILVAQIGMEVARGLAYAHRLTENGRSLELVHRDVTPHNVLLSFDGAVKLGDFGIAKAGNPTTSGTLKGKFAYMSPEQARGDAVDARTDVFALGVTLWELLTGSRLFDGDGDVAVLRAVQERVVVPPARLNPDVPASLDAAVMRALERDPARRWPTAHELERALAGSLLAEARSLEDTDVGAFLRRMFPEEAGVADAPAAGDTVSIPISLSGSSAPREAPQPPTRTPTRMPPRTPARSPVDDAATEAHPLAAAPLRAPEKTFVLPRTGRARTTRRVVATVLALALVAGGALAAVTLRRPGRADAIASPAVAGRERPAPRATAVREPEALPPSPAAPPAREVAAAPSGGVVAPGGTPAVTVASAPDPEPSSPSVAAPSAPAGGEGSPGKDVALASAAGSPSGSARPATLVTRAEGETPSRSAQARLVVHAKPWVEVRVDGRRKYTVQGSRVLHLSPGRHVLEFTGNDRQSRTVALQLESGQLRNIDYPLAR